MYSKIVNPETGKKIKLNSKKGKIILNKYLNLIGGSKCNKTNPKPPCKKGYEIGDKKGACKDYQSLSIGDMEVEELYEYAPWGRYSADQWIRKHC